jgi:hypothetical protein
MKHRRHGIVARLYTLGIVVAALFAFFTTHSHATEDWDLSWLLEVDPNKVTNSELSKHAEYAEDHYKKFHQAEGILFQAYRTSGTVKDPDIYGSGGDSLLFTGYYLGAATFRYLVTKSAADLDQIVETVRGMYILTHISGVPGVLMRCAIPKSRAKKWNYPEAWGGRIADGFVYESPANIQDPFHPGQNFEPFYFYTRVTRDQVSGMLFGLSVAWKLLDPKQFADNPEAFEKLTLVRKVISQSTNDIWWYLRKFDFKIVDQTKRNDTNADTVDSLLKLQLLALYKSTLKESTDGKRYMRIFDKYKEEFNSYFGFFGDPANWFNRWSNVTQYYAWNLRFARAYAVWLLEDNMDRKEQMAEFIDSWLFSFIKEHQNAYFNILFNATRKHPKDFKKMSDAIFGLKAVSLRPLRGYSSPLVGKDLEPSFLEKLFNNGNASVIPMHLREPTSYFKWQEDPWSVGNFVEHDGLEENVGLDFLLPYWIARYYGFIAAQ